MRTTRRTKDWIGAGLAAALTVAGISAIHGPAPAASPRATSPAADARVVMTDKGPVRGTVNDDTREFQGIPYAAPPVRWGSPRPAARWTRPLDATKPGPRCAQSEGVAPEVEPRSESEDCLYLNVTAPRHPRDNALPVMVWIHGSGFRNGGGDLYGPQKLATQGDVVVVTFNYRLGFFGFLAHPALDGGPAKNRSGNFGLEDQQQALRWVQRNASAFGGDADNVTIFGESAGGNSTCSQLTSPAAAGLFDRAIIQSGPCLTRDWADVSGVPDPTSSWLPVPRDLAEDQGRTVAKTLGCTDPATVAACLRGKPARELLAVAEKIRFTSIAPVYGGGGLLPRSPAAAIASGRFNKVPVMHGITRDEYHLFHAVGKILLQQPPLTEATYNAQVREYFGEPKASQVLAHYPADRYDGPDETWSKLVTDMVFGRSTSDMNHALARQVPTYAYEFADREAPWMSGLPEPTFPLRAFHAAELQYQFDTDYYAGKELTAKQQRLSDQMIRYWTRFAHTGNPNGPGTPYWRPASQAPESAQSLAPGRHGIRPVNFDREHLYGFWWSY